MNKAQWLARAVAALAALATVAACGSTVQPTSGVAADSGVDELTAPSSAATQSRPAGTGTAAVTAPGAGSTAGSGLTTAGGSSTTTDLTSPTHTGHGGTAPVPASVNPKLPPIEIGTYYLQGGGAALAAAGFAGVVIPDNKPLFDAMVKYLNAHGGLGDRLIKPVEFKYSSSGDPHAQDAAACADFTQDHHVYLVVGGISSGAGDLPACLTKHGVPLIGANLGGDARYFADNHQFIYEPGQVNFTLGLATLVNDLWSQHFFSGTVKVGVVQYEGPTYDRAVNDGLVAALAQHGMQLKDRVVVTSATDNSVIASDSANAVLKFSTEGINRVIFMAPGGAVATYFMQAASTQHYHPRYGIWSSDSPYVLAITGAKDQLVNSMGIGYQPGLDVQSSEDPTATTPAAKACIKFWNTLGQSDNSGLNSPLKRAMCDGFNTLLRAVAFNTHTLTSTVALEAGYNAIGTSYSPAATFLMRVAPGGHDMANGYRRLAYQSGCSCFVYSGSTLRLR
jgi:ABC-type branched-subunit amino acid transport system substrate-binding protein